MTRVLIIGDHPFSRLCLVALVSSTDDLEVVGECDGTAVRAALAEHGPHVVVMDVRARDTSGAHPAGHVRRARPTARLLILTGDTSAHTRAAVRASGAAGYVIKGSDPTAVLDAIRKVAVGLAWPQEEGAAVATAS